MKNFQNQTKKWVNLLKEIPEEEIPEEEIPDWKAETG